MDPMLVVDEDGVVRGVNPAARDLLGRGTGQRCWDVVGGLWGDRRPACVEGCATRLRNLPKLRADHGVVRIRGVDHALVCVAVGEGPLRMSAWRAVCGARGARRAAHAAPARREQEAGQGGRARDDER